MKLLIAINENTKMPRKHDRKISEKSKIEIIAWEEQQNSAGREESGWEFTINFRQAACQPCHQRDDLLQAIWSVSGQWRCGGREFECETRLRAGTEG